MDGSWLPHSISLGHRTESDSHWHSSECKTLVPYLLPLDFLLKLPHEVVYGVPLSLMGKQAQGGEDLHEVGAGLCHIEG